MITDNGADIHLTESMIKSVWKRGRQISASEITKSASHWQGMLRAGEKELEGLFTEAELAQVTEVFADQVREDELTHRDFWGLSAARIGEIVRMRAEKLADRCLKLSELGAMALKEMAGSVITMNAGGGGRRRIEN